MNGSPNHLFIVRDDKTLRIRGPGVIGDERPKHGKTDNGRTLLRHHTMVLD
jgi:hypothetical protein